MSNEDTPVKLWGYAEAAKVDALINKVLTEHPLDPLEQLTTAELHQWLTFTRTVQSSLSIIERKLNVSHIYDVSRGIRVLGE